MTANVSLHRNMSNLETSLQRLSTGFKINSGKDDPAGLIASEMLRSDITGVKTGIKNTERANMMIAVADSALNEVSGLLNDIRALVTEAANTGAMSQEMIEANQLQVNASLEAIDRIAASTSFMGRNLLDGSLDFQTTGVDRRGVQNLQIQEVKFGTDHSPIDVTIEVKSVAKKAELYYNHTVLADDVTLSWGGNLGYTQQSFKKGASVQEIANAVNKTTSATGVVAEVSNDAIKGQLYISSLGSNNDIIIDAGTAGADASCIDVKFVKGSSEGIEVEYTPSLGADYPAALKVYLQTSEYKNAVADDIDTTLGVDGKPFHDNNALKFTANIAGDQYNNVSINYVDGQRTQEGFVTDNPTGTAGLPHAYFNEAATNAVALMGDVNGLQALTNVAAGTYAKFTATAAGAEYNNTAIRMVDGTSTLPVGLLARATYSAADNTYQIEVAAGATYGDVRDALAREGTFNVEFSDNSHTQYPPTSGMASVAVAAADLGTARTTANTQNSGGDAGTLFIVLPPDTAQGAVGDDALLDANAIAAIFDLNNPASRGSERAAALFNVERTVDNDGTGKISLYARDTDAAKGIAQRKTEFKNVFTGGQTGGEVISTSGDVVAALNNSEYWGTAMCADLLNRLKEENYNGIYYDATDPPVITARRAPSKAGDNPEKMDPVSVFSEVAYYGSPDDGTGIQFLGPENSPDIRFAAEKGNDHIWVEMDPDNPDKIDFATAILNAKNPNASVTITARKKGEEYDDVLFQIKKASDMQVGADLGKKDGWVEYDPGESFAEAEIIFRTSASPPEVLRNTAFYVTADERGDMANNTPITMRSVIDQQERVLVTYNSVTGGIDVSLNAGLIDPAAPAVATTANDVIAAINAAGLGFTASLSQSNAADWGVAPFPSENDGTGTFATLALTDQPTTIGNTGDTGGHKGTVTVWMTNDESGGATTPPTSGDLIRLINEDPVVGQLFTANTYANTPAAGTGAIDFIYDGPLVSSGGLLERGILKVHLVTDKDGLIQTTARDLVEWWDQQDPETVANISASLLRRPTDVWDECNDDGGQGILKKSDTQDICEVVFEDINFVGWGEDCEQPYNYVPSYARGTITNAVNGINASYDLVAKRSGPELNDYTIRYVNDQNVTGSFSDNIITTTKLDECGNLVTPRTMSQDGLYLNVVKTTDGKMEIEIHINEGVTTAYDIKQLIENDPATKLLFGVELKGAAEGGDGKGLGKVSVLDDTLVTKNGALAPGSLNGAKLLFGADAQNWGLVFKSQEYGSRAFVDVQGIIINGVGSDIPLTDINGNPVDHRATGTDAEVLTNGIKTQTNGWNANLSSTTLKMTYTLDANTQAGYTNTFTIDGGGATFQMGPDVVSSQQITLGIPSINTVKLGGNSGRLYQLYSGENADLFTDTNLAFRIVEDAITEITSIRGRFGAMQKTTFETNINVLSDTLEALSAAQSQIRDTDFAEETSSLTRNQVLVQSNINTLGIANQLPNYILGLLQ